MKNLLNNIFTYFSLPCLFASACLSLFYYTPGRLAEGILVLIIPIVFLPFAGSMLGHHRLGVIAAASRISRRSTDKLVLYTLSGLIVILGPVDIIENGFKLANPSTYADLSGVGRYIRHLSSLCWVLVPVAFFLVKNRLLKIALIFYAIAFPILIVDRNRLLLVFYVLAFSYAVTRDGRKVAWTAFFGVIFLMASFSIIGHFRSGDAFAVESSGNHLTQNYLPLRDTFFLLPAPLQQIVLYITTPIFNFATIYAESFVNTDFLLRQLSPFGREAFDAYPDSPFLVPRFNVGTEFLPFLTFGGIQFVYPAIFIMYLGLLISAQYFSRQPNVFSLLIFLKISHTIIFMGFAPQFFILLNGGFIGLILILYLFSSLLNCICITPLRCHPASQIRV